MKTATIIGSGLVGSLWAIFLSKAGYKVQIYEKRPDMRLAKISAGKSINLATSFRGWKALDEIGIGDEIRKIAIPMYGRTIHSLDSTTAYQPYGLDNQAIYSVSRGEINAKLMNIAEADGHTRIHFNEECVNVDLANGKTFFRNTENGALSDAKADVVFATDGAFSAARYHGLQKLDQFTYSQQYIPDGYKEILLPANPDGSYKLPKETLHIWPRGRFMLIALPNFDGSFTCTLFMPFKEHEFCFDDLKTKEDVTSFFKIVFPDFYRMMPDVADSWDLHPLSSLAIIRCFPWTSGKTALMGDAAHATVPFFGQGMNCGFEDCTVMYDLMKEYNEDWPKVFRAYENSRKPNTDAMQDLSVQNYTVMRDRVTDPDYQLQLRIERRINEMYPQKYFPLYSMVSFTDIAYKTALEKGNEQDRMIRYWVALDHLTNHSTTEEIDAVIHKHFQAN